LADVRSAGFLRMCSFGGRTSREKGARRDGDQSGLR